MDGKTVIQEPRKRIMVRRLLESAPYIMYRYAEDFGIMDDFVNAGQDLCKIAGLKLTPPYI